MIAPRRVVFLDRDGVITVPAVVDGKGYAVHTLAELELYPDAIAAVERLRAAGYDIVVVTNQPDIAAGTLAQVELDAMHAWLLEQLALTRIHTCPHSARDDCDCRKPRPGLLQAEARLGAVDFGGSWMVGDRDSDVAAGAAAGCRTVFIDRGWAAEHGHGADAVAATLDEAADAILST